MKQKGFTLIEILVVIGIMGMLMAVAIPNFLSARQRADDSKRKNEAQSLKSALQLYYNDFTTYPASFNGGTGKFNYIKGCGLGGTGECPCSSSLDFASGASCDNVYMKKFPKYLGTSTFYYQASSGNDFCLRVLLNNASDPDIATSQSRCASACGNNCNTSSRYCVCAD